MLAVVEVGHTQLGEEEYCKDQINDRENDIVYNRLDLIRCIVPGTFNGTRHIAGAGGKGRGTEQANCQQEDQKHAEELFVLGHKKPPFFWKERP